MKPAPRAAACVAAVLFAGAVLAFGAALPGYSQSLHPVALLGARGVPHALAFDVLGFIVPGLLCAWTAVRVRASLPDATGWTGRIGAQAMLLSTLAFALQGVFALDPDDLDATASRMHAGIWMVWWIAFAAGACLLAAARWRVSRGWALSLLAMAAALPAFALAGSDWMPAALAQRLADALWFACLVALAPPVQGRTSRPLAR